MRPVAARVALASVVVVAASAAVVATRTDREAVVDVVDVAGDRRAEAAGAGGAAAEAAGAAEDNAGSSGVIDLPVLAGAAPEVEATGWLNTEPLTSVDLQGRVVLYEFWTFGCINCRNVLPHVKAWHERYADDGLVVLSVHTPEFDYEKDPDAVAEFVAEEAIGYPVALDPERRTWRAFENHYWPAFYLHDSDGNRRLVHYGEGAYDETEDAIRSLLGVSPDAPRAEVAG